MKARLSALAAGLLLIAGGYLVTVTNWPDDTENVKMAILFKYKDATAKMPVNVYYEVNGEKFNAGRRRYEWRKEITVPKGSTVALYGHQNVARHLECILQVGNRPIVQDKRDTMGGVLCWSQGSIGPGSNQK